MTRLKLPNERVGRRECPGYDGLVVVWPASQVLLPLWWWWPATISRLIKWIPRRSSAQTIDIPPLVAQDPTRLPHTAASVSIIEQQGRQTADDLSTCHDHWAVSCHNFFSLFCRLASTLIWAINNLLPLTTTAWKREQSWRMLRGIKFTGLHPTYRIRPDLWVMVRETNAFWSYWLEEILELARHFCCEVHCAS